MFPLRVSETKWINIKEVISRWYTEESTFVAVETEDGRKACLRYDAPKDVWTPYLYPVRNRDSGFTTDEQYGSLSWVEEQRLQLKERKENFHSREYKEDLLQNPEG